MDPLRIRIDRRWSGEPAADGEVVDLWLRSSEAGLSVRFEAPFFDDPAPPHPVGPCPGLWGFEVVELFLLGADERYLEVEVGPRGHHLLLELHGERNLQREGMQMRYDAELDNGRWSGRFALPTSLLPPGLRRYNAYAIRGVGASRRYFAAYPGHGARPDFHRLTTFAELPDALRIV